MGPFLPSRDAARRDARRLVLLALGALAIASYKAVGAVFYGGFRLPQGTGMTHLVPEENTFLLMFSAFGSVALIALAAALAGTAPVNAAARWLQARKARAWPLVIAGAVASALASAAIGHLVLGRAVVTDDEHTYRFIAQTLRTGSLTAPSPGTDLEFFREQFVVLTPDARYGKYPLGFPLLLAVGQAMDLEAWVAPFLTGAIVALVYVVGAALFDSLTALIATALVASSPQIILTGATYLSQPASGACLLGGIAALAIAERRRSEAGRESLGLLLAAGALLGWGAFVRPLPGVLFVAAAGLHLLWRRRALPPTGLLGAAGAFASTAIIGIALLLLQNRAQSGGFLTSGYQTFHATGPGSAGLLFFFGGPLADVAMSLVASAARSLVWAFGWPFAPLLALFAWRLPRSGILWAMIGAALAYRVFSPKAGVSPTGPVYFYEIVPIVALLAAAGVCRLAREGPSRFRLDAVLVAGAIVSAAMFLPGRLADLSLMGLAQRTPAVLLERRGVHRAVVFHAGVVPWQSRLSWAYYPPHNSPALDDDILFLRVDGRADLATARALWRRRYPDRSAWWFEYMDGRPRLVPLDEALSEPERAPVPGSPS